MLGSFKLKGKVFAEFAKAINGFRQLGEHFALKHLFAATVGGWRVCEREEAASGR